MNKLTAIRIKNDDNTYSDQIPVSVLAENVQWDSTHNLIDIIGEVDVDTVGNIQGQIDNILNRLWTDTSLSIAGKFADAKATGDAIYNLRGVVGTPLTAATAASMTNTDKIYVYTGSETRYTNGNWYYHNGTTWVSGGVYNSIAMNMDTLPIKNSINPVTSNGLYQIQNSLNNFDNNIIKDFDEQSITIDGKLYRGNFQQNVFNPVTNKILEYKYRISARHEIVFPYEITLKIDNDFRLLPYRLENGEWKQKQWVTTTYVLPANEPMYCQIARVSENLDEIADIDLFISKVTFVPKAKSYPLYLSNNKNIDDGVSISNQISEGVAKGYNSFVFSGNEKIGYFSTPITLHNNIIINGNGAVLIANNLATTGITPSRIISATGISNVNIKNIIFQGSSSSQTASSGIPDNLIYLNQCNHITFTNCKITKYDTDIDTSLDGYDNFSRSERWSAFVALSCTYLNLINFELTLCKREGITLSQCTQFYIEGFNSYDNYQTLSYSPLSLFDCNYGKINNAYIYHRSETSAINFFTSNTIFCNSIVYSNHNSSSGFDLGNEIEVNHYFENNIISNNILKCNISRVGTTYGHNNLMIIGNYIDAHFNTGYGAGYAIAMPCGNISIINNIIIAGSSRYCIHCANSPGKKIIKNNVFFGTSAFNIATREEEMTIFSSQNYTTGTLLNLSTFEYVDPNTQFNFYSNGDITENKLISSASTSKIIKGQIYIYIYGGQSTLSSILNADIDIYINGHIYTGIDSMISIHSNSSLSIFRCNAMKASLINVTSGTIDGNIAYCTANSIISDDSTGIDETVKQYNVILN